MATYVFIPGAGDVAWSWGLVAGELRALGHDTVAVDLPCDDESAGLAEYVDAVVEAIGERRELILVGHSLGAFTAPLVCARVPADLLVLVAGMVPKPDETANDWWVASGYQEATREQQLDDESEIAIFLHDVPPELAAEALAKGRDQAEAPMLEPWPLDAWPQVPTRYLLFRDDRVFPAAFARRLARERLGVEADEIDGGHCAYLSRPREVAQRLDSYLAQSG